MYIYEGENTLSVTVIVVGNEIGDQSSNPARDRLHFILC